MHDPAMNISTRRHEKHPPICTSSMDSPIGRLILAATGNGLCGLYLEGQQHMPDTTSWLDDASRFDPVRTQLADYFAGQRAAFTLPLEIAGGTAFQRQVWEALKLIPPGQTWTYARLAGEIGRPAAVRAVGAAVGRNPLSIVLPCHRIVGSDGSLTGYAGGMERKRWLLEHERAGGTAAASGR